MIINERDIRRINRRIKRIEKLQNSNSFNNYIKSGKLFKELKEVYPGIEYELVVSYDLEGKITIRWER